MAFVLGFVYILVIGAVLFSMAVLLLKGRKEKCNRIYLGCQMLVVVWCVSQVLLLLSQSELEVALSYGLGNAGICFIGALWYYFSVLYTGGALTKVRVIVPLLSSVFHYGLVLTNSRHHLYYKEFRLDHVEHGFFFYTNVLATYVFVIVGAVKLYRNLDDEQCEHGAKGLIIASVLAPVFLNAVNLSGMLSVSFDVTPLGFGISVICVLMATLKYRFLDLKRELEITNEKLILEKERNRIAQEVHDTAGHTLTMIQSYMKLAQVANQNTRQEEVAEYLLEARNLTSQGIKELRESINHLKEGAHNELVTQGIMQLANQVKEIPVEVTVKGEDSEKYSHLSSVIYDCVRESITNTLKYANASRMDIVVRFLPDCIDVMIGDDGCGCKDIVSNHGLSGIQRRIEEAGGTVRFRSDEGEGFLTRIHLPLFDKKHIF